MIVRELLTRLGFTTDEAAVKRYLGSINGVAAASKALVAVSTLAAAAALAATRALGEESSELLKLRDIFDLTVDELQRLRFIASQSNVEFPELVQGMKFLAREGAKLGLSGGLTDQMRQVSALVVKAGSAAERSQIAVKAFGKSGQSLLPLLLKGPDAVEALNKQFGDLHFMLSERVLEDANEVNDQISELLSGLRSFRLQVAADLLPGVRVVVGQLRAWWRANRELIRQRTGETIRALLIVLKPLGALLLLVAQLTWGVVEALGGMENVVRLLIVLIGAKLVVAIGRWVAAMALARGGLLALTGASILAGLRALGATLLAVFTSPVLAIAALVLLLQDLWVWFKGGDSAIGQLVGSFEDLTGKLTDLFESVGNTLRGWWDGIVSFFEDRITAIENRIIAARAGLADLLPGGETGADVYRRYFAPEGGAPAAAAPQRGPMSLGPFTFGDIAVTLAGGGAGAANLAGRTIAQEIAAAIQRELEAAFPNLENN